MACFAPLDGWRSRERTESGKRAIVFDARTAYRDLPVTLACGKCIGCRLERSRQWAVRCVHEASLWEKNVFATLTYKELPPGGSLRPRDFVLFMKRLRKERECLRCIVPCDHGKVRFFHCGEYGAGGRPHHHVLLFNCSFDDGEVFKKAPSGEVIYRSKELERLWPHGFSSFGNVTFQSAGYVARYSLKKVSVSQLSGREPEYLTMSRRKGIGAAWISKYHADVYPRDELVLSGGKVCRPPRFYDQVVGFKRLPRKDRDPKEGGSSRLIQKRVCAERSVSDRLKRSL